MAADASSWSVVTDPYVPALQHPAPQDNAVIGTVDPTPQQPFETLPDPLLYPKP